MAGTAPVSQSYAILLQSNIGGMKTRISKLAVAHSARFRAVSTRYPRRVAEAYKGHDGISQAARDIDGKVAKMVAAWERLNGFQLPTGRDSGSERRDDR